MKRYQRRGKEKDAKIRAQVSAHTDWIYNLSHELQRGLPSKKSASPYLAEPAGSANHADIYDGHHLTDFIKCPNITGIWYTLINTKYLTISSA